MISNTQAKFDIDTCRDAIVEMHTTIETRLAPGITHLINRAILKSDGTELAGVMPGSTLLSPGFTGGKVIGNEVEFKPSSAR